MMFSAALRLLARLPLLLLAPTLAPIDVLENGRLGVLHLARACLLMGGTARAASRDALLERALASLSSRRTVLLALPLLGAVLLALSVPTVARASSSPAACLGAFFALLLGVVVFGVVRIMALPGARTVVYGSDSIRRNGTNAVNLLLRFWNLLLVMSLALAPFRRGSTSAFAMADASAFGRRLRDEVLPWLDAAAGSLPGLPAEAARWAGAAAALLLVAVWLVVGGLVLRRHDVEEQREALYARHRLLSAFEVVGDKLLVFVATKLFAFVHCTEGPDGAWRSAVVVAGVDEGRTGGDGKDTRDGGEGVHAGS